MERAKFTINVQHRERVPLQNGGFTTRELPSTQETVVVEVDFQSLAKMLGPKAATSKGGKAVEASGCVIVRHIR